MRAAVLAFALLAPQDDLQKGARALEARDYGTAIQHFQAAAKKDPKNVAVLSSLGYALAGAGRFPEAATQFRTLTKLEPNAAGHHYNLGLALLNANIHDEAEKAFRAVLRLAPKHPRARAQLANALLGQARGGDNSKMKEAAAAYAQAVPENPRDPEMRFNYAFTLARTGDEEGALREYRQVVQLAPRMPQGYFFLGITSFQLGNWDEALQNLRAAAARGQNDFYLHYFLGSTLLKKRDTAPAQEHLQTAAKMNAEHPGVHFQLAALYRALGDKQRSAEEQAAFRDLNARQDAKWRAEMLERAAGNALRKGDLQQGVSSLLQAFEARPDAVLARNLGLAYLQQGDLAKASEYLDKAVQMSPRDAATFNYLGLLAARKSDLPLAYQHFEKAAKLDPMLAEASFNAGIAAAELKRHDAAIAHLRAALRRDNSPRIRETLARVLADAGRHDESQREFEMAQKQHVAAGTNP